MLHLFSENINQDTDLLVISYTVDHKKMFYIYKDRYNGKIHVSIDAVELAKRLEKSQKPYLIDLNLLNAKDKAYFTNRISLG